MPQTPNGFAMVMLSKTRPGSGGVTFEYYWPAAGRPDG
ncbi:hypothetical protein FRUB_08719 [Fimbriiglobus ruber]|uniref:Uncharacterized protein n=1 Tax=Fimbriiglobus ruber TaxID=1908690 RepID=A0A225DFM6_9BACT|nr:hypothetical protein FRUB_08719 [Fimbriiglobus ruber]